MNRFNQRIALVLKIGINCSMTIIIVGLILFFLTGQSGYSLNTYPQSITEIMSGVSALKPFAIITLGLFVLILTPVVRIVTAMIGFIIEKDYLYVTITISVLIILMMSFMIGTLKS